MIVNFLILSILSFPLIWYSGHEEERFSDSSILHLDISTLLLHTVLVCVLLTCSKYKYYLTHTAHHQHQTICLTSKITFSKKTFCKCFQDKIYWSIASAICATFSAHFHLSPRFMIHIKIVPTFYKNWHQNKLKIILNMLLFIL